MARLQAAAKPSVSVNSLKKKSLIAGATSSVAEIATAVASETSPPSSTVVVAASPGVSASPDPDSSVLSVAPTVSAEKKLEVEEDELIEDLQKQGSSNNDSGTLLPPAVIETSVDTNSTVVITDVMVSGSVSGEHIELDNKAEGSGKQLQGQKQTGSVLSRSGCSNQETQIGSMKF
ncbi:hypothetical protein Bca4012_078547 [Brassica carinata]